MSMELRLRVAERLRALAVRSVRRGWDGAERQLDQAELAGHVAWMTHGGAFALPEVESALQQCSLASAPAPAGVDIRAIEGRTLHVLTEAYAVGGHTRMARRWVEIMQNERHAIVLVRQQRPVPRSAIVPESLDVPLLDLRALGIVSSLERTVMLRELFLAARRVILHIHPDDACSVAAAHGAPGADIRFVNHADHVAWLGASLPATFLNLRASGAILAEYRRGIDLTACDTIPVPVTLPKANVERQTARERLGFGNGDVVLLTIAAAYKYLPIGERSLQTLLDTALRHANVRLLVVGPDASHPFFAPLQRKFAGQVFVLGTQPDAREYRAAADIYLDSYPFGSLTSMLESAAMNTPIVSFQPDAEQLGVLYSESPCVPGSLFTSGNAISATQRLDLLIGSAQARRDTSDAVRQAIAGHLPEGFRVAIERSLARPSVHPQWRGKALVEFGDLDQMLAGLGQDPLVYEYAGRLRALHSLDALQFRAIQVQGRFAKRLQRNA